MINNNSNLNENNVENDHGVGSSWCSHAHWLAQGKGWSHPKKEVL